MSNGYLLEEFSRGPGAMDGHILGSVPRNVVRNAVVDAPIPPSSARREA